MLTSYYVKTFTRRSHQRLHQSRPPIAGIRRTGGVGHHASVFVKQNSDRSPPAAPGLRRPPSWHHRVKKQMAGPITIEISGACAEQFLDFRFGHPSSN